MTNKNTQKRRIILTGVCGIIAIGILSGASVVGINVLKNRSVENTVDSIAVISETTSTAGVLDEEISMSEPEAEPSYSGGRDVLIGSEPIASDEEIARFEENAARLGKPEGYSTYLETSMGTILYYNQEDPRWKDYLWGGEDSMDVYGCGPTVMAMLANAFGNQGNVTPIQMAEWADANGQRSSHQGSLHSIVNTTMEAYGLNVESLNDKLNKETMTNMLKSGHILVALVGPGYFTDGGHFILIRGINEDGTVNVADPANRDNNDIPFTTDFILGELKLSASDYGGPLWAISLP